MSAVVGYGSNNYSTEEKVVGTWIDGKPIYQKTLRYANTIAKATEILIGSLDTVVADVICIDYTVKTSSGDSWYSPSSSIERFVVRVNVSNGNVYIYCDGGPWNSPIFITTIQYTKTTD